MTTIDTLLDPLRERDEALNLQLVDLSTRLAAMEADEPVQVAMIGELRAALAAAQNEIARLTTPAPAYVGTTMQDHGAPGATVDITIEGFTGRDLTYVSSADWLVVQGDRLHGVLPAVVGSSHRVDVTATDAWGRSATGAVYMVQVLPDAPRFVGQTIELRGPAGTTATTDLTGLFAGHELAFADLDPTDAYIVAGDGRLAVTFPAAGVSVDVRARVIDPWNRSAEALVARVIGEAVAPPPPPPSPVEVGDQWRFRSTDAGEGPSRDAWNKSLNIAWANVGGDWRDADGVAQGSKPFAEMTVSSVDPIVIELADIKRFVGGVLLTFEGRSSPTVEIGGRLSAKPPTLDVLLSDGSRVQTECWCVTGWSPSSHKASDTRQGARLTTTDPVLVQHAIPADAVSATLTLHPKAKNSYPGLLKVFACDPPGIRLPWLETPELGLAAEVGDESKLQGHPDVIVAGDFSLESMERMFDQLSISDNCDPQYLTRPDGRVGFRGRFRSRYEIAETTGKSLTWVDQNSRGSFGGLVQIVGADLTDPRRPPLPGHKVMHARLYFLLEDNWRARNDGNKMAIGWDMRQGVWVDGSGPLRGYWQQTTGNGGARGTGLMLLAPPGRVTAQKDIRWEVQGHSIRMESGMQPIHPGDPYERFRGPNSYTYHLDQYDFNGTIERFGNAVIERGRKHCIEQRIQLNTVRAMTPAEIRASLIERLSSLGYGSAAVLSQWADPDLILMGERAFEQRPLEPLLVFRDGFDIFGNGWANHDGELTTWIDGVMVMRRTGLRFIRHPLISIEGPWLNWFFGGKQASECEMHYQMDDLVVATRYIGLRV